jgi:hypothetical protein
MVELTEIEEQASAEDEARHPSIAHKAPNKQALCGAEILGIPVGNLPYVSVRGASRSTGATLGPGTTQAARSDGTHGRGDVAGANPFLEWLCLRGASDAPARMRLQLAGVAVPSDCSSLVLIGPDWASRRSQRKGSSDEASGRPWYGAGKERAGPFVDFGLSR